MSTVFSNWSVNISPRRLMSAVSSLVVNDVFRNTLLKDAKNGANTSNVGPYTSTDPIISVKLRLPSTHGDR